MPDEAKFITSSYPAAPEYVEDLQSLARLCEASPIPGDEFIDQLALYATPASLRRLVHFDRLYQKILDVPGVLMVFGVRWGRDLAALHGLQQIYEPMNHARRVLGFDTFAGLTPPATVDGEAPVMRTGAYSVTEAYEEHLAQVLAAKSRLGSFAHTERVQLFKGDAVERLRYYLDRHPETIVAFTYFDLDIHEPTKACAELLLPYLASGAVVAFDEFIHPICPGETVAARQVFGSGARFRREPGVGPAHGAYLIYEGRSSGG
jgi:hypothetical protein